MVELRTNVLVIGKSGVGKSSLLNYIFNKEIQKTGTGEPVTKKGIYPFDYQYDEHFKVCIYDTWGLEPDKAIDWKTLIMDEVKKHDKLHVSEWFNTIIFCLSANAERVEDFELDIIKALVEKNNQMVIAITHCNDATDKRAFVVKKRVVESTRVRAEQVVFVNNVEKKLIGKKSVVRFGRNEIFDIIINNLWTSLKEKVPYNITQNLIGAFDEEKDRFNKEISNQWFLFQRDKKLAEFENKVNGEFRSFLKTEMSRVNDGFCEAMDYYNALSVQYAEIGLLDKETIINMPEMRFEALQGFKKEVKEQVDTLRNNFGNVLKLLNEDASRETLQQLGLALKKYFSSSKTIKKSLNETVDSYLKEARGILLLQIDQIQKQLQAIDIIKVKNLMLSEG